MENWLGEKISLPYFPFGHLLKKVTQGTEVFGSTGSVGDGYFVR